MDECMGHRPLTLAGQRATMARMNTTRRLIWEFAKSTFAVLLALALLAWFGVGAYHVLR